MSDTHQSLLPTVLGFIFLISSPLTRSYEICIRPEAGFCCVQYSVCADQAAANAMSLDPALTTAMTDNACLTVDHVSIPESCKKASVCSN